MDTCARAQVKAPRIMSGAYRCILEAAIARGFAFPRTLRKPKARMLMIAARYALF